MSLVNVFFYDLDHEAIVMVQKLDHPDLPFALPGGTSEDDEDVFATASRETTEEVGKRAAEGLAKNWKGDEIEIDRGKYKQYVLLVPYSSELRREGLSEKTEDDKEIERLGPPQWIPFGQIQEGFVLTEGGRREICFSHMNAIHEAFAMLDENDPTSLDLLILAEATKKFAFG